MKKLAVFLIFLTLGFTGCGIGVSDYDDAVLEGVSNLNLKKPEKAFGDFNRALELDPNRVDGYIGRANALNAMQRYEEALIDYDKAIEIDPQLANAYVNRGSVYSHLGQYKKAIADYEKGLELDPKIDDPPTFVQRLFSNAPNTDKGIRKHLEYLKQKAQNS
jgi:tetratricopeptide (TPR) repeat protein